MKRLLLASALLAAAIGVAHADNIAIAVWTDGTDLDTGTGLGALSVGPLNLDGITLTSAFGLRSTHPSNGLTEGTINIDNTTGSTQTLDIILGANSYAGKADEFAVSGTLLVSAGSPAVDLSGSFFVDGANVLNGTSTTIAGTDIRDFNSGSLTGPFSFAFNGFGADAVTGPYGMAEFLSLTLAPGASVAIEGSSMDAVPEPKTWALSLIGFGLLGAMGFRRARTARFAI